MKAINVKLIQDNRRVSITSTDIVRLSETGIKKQHTRITVTSGQQIDVLEHMFDVYLDVYNVKHPEAS